jgi:hypothetical protein
MANLVLTKPFASNLVAIAGAGGFGLPLLVAQHSLPRELDFVAVLADALDEDLLPFFQFVTHVLDTAIGNLGNVQQTVCSGKDFNKRPKVHNSVYRAEISLADLGFRRETSDTIDRRLSSGGTRGRNRDSAIVRNVDLGPRLFNQRSNNLAAWSNDVANLVGIDLDLDDSWRVLRDFCA